MTKEEKLTKVCSDFSSLNDEKQDYILGILQALVFANTVAETRPDAPSGPPDRPGKAP